ncbi:MAG: 23S rRNA (adenine(2503)-C(2))-methyltransferase RlmN [bacterium]
MASKKINLFDLTYPELEQALIDVNQPKFRAQQLCNWFYKNLVSDTKLMLNVPQDLRAILDREFLLDLPVIHDVAQSKTDESYKFLLKTRDNNLIESILMVDGERATICLSCMIGCPMACKFCATGSEVGFVRKLTTSEIVGQVLVILRYAQEHEYVQRITNIVFMGMGEPFLNKESVEKAINIFTHPKCMALSPAKISVSTAGVGPGIADFINKTQVLLAVSVHFPTNELRIKYMPANTKFPLENLIAELKKITLKKRDYIFIEYLLLAGVNDSLVQAKQLHKLIAGLKVKVNLIPYNPTATLPGQAPSEKVINEFAMYLRDKDIFTSVRRSKGLDIEGGCGQFVLKQQ